MVELAPQSKSTQLLSVQVLRAIAAALVVALHAQYIGLNSAHFDHSQFSSVGFLNRGFGVDIFFVISGFVICLSSDRVLQDRNVVEFLRRRIVRIVPLYWLCTVIWILLSAAKILMGKGEAREAMFGVSDIISSFLFIPRDTHGFGDLFPFPVLDLGWTLNFEMLFYFVFGASILLGAKKAYAGLFAGILGLIFVGTIFTLPLPWSFWCQPITLEFLSGVVLAMAYKSGFRLGAVYQLLLLALGVAVLLFARESFFGAVPADAKGSYSWPRVASGGVGAFMVMAAATLGQWRLSGKPAEMTAKLGDSSYALYLTHPMTFVVLRLVIELAFPKIVWSWSWVLLFVFCAVVVAHAFHLIVEKRLQELANNVTLRLSPTKLAIKAPIT